MKTLQLAFGPYSLKWLGLNHWNSLRFGRATSSAAFYLGLIKIAWKRRRR